MTEGKGYYQIGEPNGFSKIIAALPDDDKTDFRKLGSELEGLRGPLSKEIAQWHREGLGRFIGTPISAAVNDDKQVDNKYRRLAYVLPLTNETVQGHDKRIVLIFAAEKGPHVVRVLGPNQSTHSARKVRVIENENYLNDFDSLFQPSDKPALIAQWSPKLGEDLNESFNNHIHLFPVAHHSTTDSSKIVEDAVANARRLKVYRIRTDEYSMRAMLDSSTLAEIEVLSNDWEGFKREEDMNLFTTLFDNNDKGTPETA